MKHASKLLVLVLAAVIAVLPIQASASVREVGVSIDYTTFVFADQRPVIVRGSTLVPSPTPEGCVFEAIGFEVEWVDGTQSVVLTRRPDFEIIVTLDVQEFTTNAEVFTADVPAQFLGHQVMLPLRAIVESMGYTVSWNHATRTVEIMSPPIYEAAADVEAPVVDEAYTADPDLAAFLARFDMDEVRDVLGLDVLHVIGDYVNADMSGTGVLVEWMFLAWDEDITDLVETLEPNDVGDMLGSDTGDILLLSFDGLPVIAIDLGPYTGEMWSPLHRLYYIAPLTAPDVEQPAAPIEVPDEAPQRVSEVLITLGSDWPVRAAVTLPAGASAESPVPAVVIVAGSGVSDMDGGIPQVPGMPNIPNKIYLDIALGLQELGIATLRFDKRTLTHGAELIEQYGQYLTVWQETIEDALFAAEFLRGMDEVDSSRIFLVGHSLGGMLAPRIQLENNDFAGLVLLGASPRTFGEVSMMQNLQTRAIMDEMGMGDVVDQIDTIIDMLRIFYDAVEYVNVPLSAEIMDIGAALGGLDALAYYIRDLASFPFSEMIAAVDVPILVLHAMLDLQVSYEDDYLAIVELLRSNPQASFATFDGLNHMFITGNPETTILTLFDEYAIPGNVDLRVTRTIAEWILAR